MSEARSESGRSSDQVVPAEMGQRLNVARRARGLTQQAVADAIGVARTTIVAMEKGERRVQPRELVALAELFGRSVGELLRLGVGGAEFAVQLRSTLSPQMDIEADLAAAVAAFQDLCLDYLELERICGAPLPRRYPAQYPLDGLDPEAVAEDTAVSERNRLGLGDGPLPHLREVLEGDVGLRVFYLELPSKIAAMFACTDRLGGCIAVNRHHPEERRRMSLAHDYGHFLTNRYQPEVVELGRYVRQPEHERFAETFARAFLMPAAGLRRRFHDLRRSRPDRLVPADLMVLGDSYQVSFEAILRRLEELRLIPSGTWDRLQLKGFQVEKARELLQLTPVPADEDLLPPRYRYLAVEALDKEELSEGQFARFLRTDRLTARSLAETIRQRTVLSEHGAPRTLSLDLGRALGQ